MSVFFILIPLSVLIAGGFLWAFVWAVRNGQYEDTCTPAMRLVMEDDETNFGKPGKTESRND